MPHVDAASIRFRYREWGTAGREPPLVLLHGAGTGSVIWAEIGERLGAVRHTIALDLPGHGQSSPLGEPPSIDLYAEHVRLFLAALGIEQAVLVGHSMGGAIALRRALDAPQSVAGLVVCAGGARLTFGPHLLSLIREQFSALPMLLESVAYSPLTPVDVVSRWSQTVLQASPDLVLADYVACEQFDARPDLGKLRVPTLVIGAQDDLLTPPKFSTYLAGQIEGARLIVMDQVGHLMMHEKPEEFAQAVLGFLEQRSSN